MPRGVRIHRVAGAHRAEGGRAVEAAPRAASGGNSTIRKIVPLAGGSSDIRRFAGSALPALEAGARSLTQRSVSAKSGRPGSVST
jgi:hypothetical protein